MLGGTIIKVVWPPPYIANSTKEDILAYVGGGQWYCSTRKVSASLDGSVGDTGNVYYSTAEVLSNFPLDAETYNIVNTITEDDKALSLSWWPSSITDLFMRLRAFLGLTSNGWFGTFTTIVWYLLLAVCIYYLSIIFNNFKRKR
jgi:hypothetical protein